MAWSSTRTAAFGFLLVIGALMAFGLVVYWNTERLRQQEQWVSHTHEVLAQLEGLFSSLKDAETGQRGFLLTGDESFLEPYHAAASQLQGRQEVLRKLVADNPEQLERIRQSGEVIAARMKELEHNIELRRSEGLEAVGKSIREGHGKQLMDDLRKRDDEMQQIEQGLLSVRKQEAQTSFRNAVLATLLSLILVGAALAVAWLLIRSEFQQRQRANQLAVQQKERLSTTLHSIGDAVIVTDAAGFVTMINPVASRLTGWGFEAIGQPLAKVFHIINEKTRAPVESPVSVVLKSGVIVGLANHTVLIAKDGNETPIDDSGAPIRDGENVVGVVLVFRDIKDRRQAEAEQERLTLRLVDADRRKDQFMATLAHELRNPLAPISNALELWPMVANDPTELDELRGIMARQVRQLIRLTDDLLDMSRISHGKIQLRRQNVDVAELVRGAVEAIRPLIERAQHQLHLQLPDESVYVDGDVARLLQVLVNLVHNAVKYTGRDGAIWISARRDNGQAVISVRDNGPGIPPEMLDQIFEMFTQVDQTLARAHGGLGIGLTLAKSIIDLHGGTISAKSDGLGRGSEFSIQLPAVDGDAELPADPPASPQSRKTFLPRHRVLVVDDVRASVRTLALMLEALGQEVETREDGASAIEAVSSYKPDIVFLDIGMPGISGLEAARQIRQKPEHANLTLVALTGYGQDEDRRQSLAAGFNCHLVKPASMEALENILAAVEPSVSPQ